MAYLVHDGRGVLTDSCKTLLVEVSLHTGVQTVWVVGVRDGVYVVLVSERAVVATLR